MISFDGGPRSTGRLLCSVAELSLHFDDGRVPAPPMNMSRFASLCSDYSLKLFGFATRTIIYIHASPAPMPFAACIEAAGLVLSCGVWRSRHLFFFTSTELRTQSRSQGHVVRGSPGFHSTAFHAGIRDFAQRCRRKIRGLLLYRIHQPIEPFLQSFTLDGATSPDGPFSPLFSARKTELVRDLCGGEGALDVLYSGGNRSSLDAVSQIEGRRGTCLFVGKHQDGNVFQFVFAQHRQQF